MTMENATHVTELFEEQVKKNPLAKAVVHQDQWITYQALDQRANQFARYLQSAYRIKGGEVIGLSIENKTIPLLVALLGILKAGAAYQPLSKNNKTSPLICVIDEGPQATQSDIPIHQIDNLSRDHSNQPLSRVTKRGDSIAYLISTSGTTGHPKTIALSHDNLAATFQSWNKIYQLNTQDRHLQMAHFSFDVFTGDWVRALCSGGTLVLCPKEDLLYPERLFSLIENNQITIAEFVPAVLRKLISYLEEHKKTLSTFRVVICGSDIWYMGECKQLKQLTGPKTRIINSYGLAEATIDATYFEYSEEKAAHLKEDSIVPIGQAFPHALIKVITSTGKEAQVGEKGEIYIGGRGVSKRGYLDNARLTEERFVRLGNDSHLFYKTGDRAEILDTQDILFLGRNENQFNIHGQRVDFLSVESVLLQHPKIKSAVVIPYVLSDPPFLEAFLALNATIHHEELIGYLKENLPTYAVPKYFYEIETVVLSANGKIVREKSQQKIVRKISSPIVAPITRTQKIITQVWEKKLQRDSIGLTEPFDWLGGTSLDYVSILSEVNIIFHTRIDPCKQLKTVTEMAREIDSAVSLSRSIQTQTQEVKSF